MISTTHKPVANRYDFCLLFEVTNGNPNGDPDAGNSPRVDPETNHGLVSDVCLKRKIRNFITQVKTDPKTNVPEDGYDIYVKERAILNQQHERAYTALKLDTEDKETKTKTTNQEKARAWMCQTFFDIRMFGAVMTTGKKNCGQVRGPVQIAFSRSIDPIVSLEQSITRMAVTTDKESDKQDGGNRTMGRKQIVPYGLYRVHGFINPFLAAQTGFHQADLQLLWAALNQMFEIDRSAARGEMAARKLFVFKHESQLGNASAHNLFDRVQIQLSDDSKPPRKFSDYKVTVNRDDLPTGVTLESPW